MLLSEHDKVSCRRCGSTMWYGLKEEPTGWKVFYVCDPQTGCGSEWRIGRISRTNIESLDEAHRRAESMWTELRSQAY